MMVVIRNVVRTDSKGRAVVGFPSVCRIKTRLNGSVLLG